MPMNPCAKPHVYFVATRSGSIGPFDEQAARSAINMIEPAMLMGWVAQHDDGSECVLAAAFQTGINVEIAVRDTGTNPSEADKLRIKLLGAFVAYAAKAILADCDMDARAVVGEVGTAILHDLPRENPTLFRKLVGALAQREERGEDFTVTMSDEDDGTIAVLALILATRMAAELIPS